MANMLPIFLNVDGQSVLVVGGGLVALEKLEKLHAAGASLLVVAKALHPTTKSFLERHGITREERAFSDADVKGRLMVISAVNDPQVHAAVAAAARARGILVNTVDEPRRADFYFGAQIERGPLTIAISTQGLFPGVARLLRLWLEESFPHEISAELIELALIRERVKLKIPDPLQRMKALRQQLAGWVSQTSSPPEMTHGPS